MYATLPYVEIEHLCAYYYTTYPGTSYQVPVYNKPAAGVETNTGGMDFCNILAKRAILIIVLMAAEFLSSSPYPYRNLEHGNNIYTKPIFAGTCKSKYDITQQQWNRVLVRILSIVRKISLNATRRAVSWLTVSLRLLFSCH